MMLLIEALAATGAVLTLSPPVVMHWLKRRREDRYATHRND